MDILSGDVLLLSTVCILYDLLTFVSCLLLDIPLLANFQDGSVPRFPEFLLYNIVWKCHRLCYRSSVWPCVFRQKVRFLLVICYMLWSNLSKLLRISRENVSYCVKCDFWLSFWVKAAQYGYFVITHLSWCLTHKNTLLKCH